LQPEQIIPDGGDLEVYEIASPRSIDFKPNYSLARAFRSKRSPAESRMRRPSADLNLDSLGRVELPGALEDRYQIELDEAAFTAATTIGEVEQQIRSLCAAGDDLDRTRGQRSDC
jgi:acyl carrier protein